MSNSMTWSLGGVTWEAELLLCCRVQLARLEMREGVGAMKAR